jgi:hypothetical protein
MNPTRASLIVDDGTPTIDRAMVIAANDGKNHAKIPSISKSKVQPMVESESQSSIEESVDPEQSGPDIEKLPLPVDINKRRMSRMMT